MLESSIIILIYQYGETIGASLQISVTMVAVVAVAAIP